MPKKEKTLEQEKAAVREWMASGHILSAATSDGLVWFGPGGFMVPGIEPGIEIVNPRYAVFTEYEPRTSKYMRASNLTFNDAMRMISEPL